MESHSLKGTDYFYFIKAFPFSRKEFLSEAVPSKKNAHGISAGIVKSGTGGFVSGKAKPPEQETWNQKQQ